LLAPSYIDFTSLLDTTGLIAAISTRSKNHKTELDRVRLAGQYGLCAEQLCQPLQVHSARVKQARRAGVYPETDGLVSDNADLVLTLQVADCVPLFLVDPYRKIIGLIHVGWRGAARGIVKRAVEQMLLINSAADGIKALIGPCIRAADFEVGPEVEQLFPKQFTQPGSGDRLHFDLPAYVSVELRRFGLSSENIIDTGLSTYPNPDRFHSFRRDGQAAGRMFAILGWHPIP